MYLFACFRAAYSAEKPNDGRAGIGKRKIGVGLSCAPRGLVNGGGVLIELWNLVENTKIGVIFRDVERYRWLIIGTERCVMPRCGMIDAPVALATLAGVGAVWLAARESFRKALGRRHH